MSGPKKRRITSTLELKPESVAAASSSSWSDSDDPGTTYLPGRSMAIVSPHSVLLMDGVASEYTTQLQALLVDRAVEGHNAEVLRALAASGAANWVFVSSSESGVVISSAGEGVVDVVEDGGGHHRLTDPSTESQLNGSAKLLISIGDAHGASSISPLLRIDTGTVPASAVRRVVVGRAAIQQPTDVVADDLPAGVIRSAPWFESSEPTPPDDPLSHTMTLGSVDLISGAPKKDRSAESSDLSLGSGGDHWSGPLRPPPGSAPRPRPVPSSTGAPSDPVRSSRTPSMPKVAATDHGALPIAKSAGDSDWLDSISWAVDRDEVVSSPRSRTGSARAAVEQVLSVQCDRQHPNPPYGASCRVCGAALATSVPTMIDRPSLGTLRFSNGRSVDLVQSVLIGRDPRLATGSPGAQPLLVGFDDVATLSRTHAEFRLADWEIVFVDHHSTNGSDVRPPDRSAQRVAGGGEVAIGPGTVIDFGDGLKCTVEAPQ